MIQKIIRWWGRNVVAFGFLGLVLIFGSSCAQGPSEEEKVNSQVVTWLISIHEALERGEASVADYYLFKLSLDQYKDKVDQSLYLDLRAKTLHLEARNILAADWPVSHRSLEEMLLISHVTDFTQDHPEYVEMFKNTVSKLHERTVRRYLYNAQMAAYAMDEKGLFAAVAKAQAYQRENDTYPLIDIPAETRRIYRILTLRRQAFSQGLIPQPSLNE